jgi:hypothetical protein
MKYKVLSQSQVDQFIETGYVKVEEAFPRKQALAVQDFLWDRLAEHAGVIKDDPSTWTQPMVHLKEIYDEDVFQACSTERLADATEDVVGEGRWASRGQKTHWGWWPVNFAVGADKPWDVPTNGWHWDGQQFKHSVTAPDQGLLLLPHFSEVRSQGGGTVIAPGTHEVVARLLAEYDEPVDQPIALQRFRTETPWVSELTGLTPPAPGNEDRIQRFMKTKYVDDHGTKLWVEEITADPGDVIIAHPFLYHSAAQNLSGKPRFMCNRTASLKEPMCLNRPDGDYSAVEISIRRALKMA